MPRKAGDEVTVTPCDTGNRQQFFTQGWGYSYMSFSMLTEKCIGIDANIYNSSKYKNCPSEFASYPTHRYNRVINTSVTVDDDPDMQIYCQYRSLADDSKEERKPALCLDIKGQQLTETSIIGFDLIYEMFMT